MHAIVLRWFQPLQIKLIYSAHLERSMKLQTSDKPSQIIMFHAEMKVKTSGLLQMSVLTISLRTKQAGLKWSKPFKNTAMTK